MRFIIINFFLIVCVGCYRNAGRHSHLNRQLYETRDFLSFDPTGFYSKESFTLFLSRSSLFKGNFSERETSLLSFANMLLSDSLEDGLTHFLHLKYDDAEAYKIEYMAPDPYNEFEKVRASGLVLAPPTQRPLPLLIFFHPTLLHKDSAPSLIPPSTYSMDPIEDYRLMMVLLALQGYIVVAPDYIGYGSSENEVHPYLHKRSVVQTTASLLFSVQEALHEERIPFQKEMFIMGYSQGGHGALAFAESVQNSSVDFKVRAVSAGGGPYDMLYTVSELLEEVTVWKTLMALLLQSYSYLYNWDLNRILKRESYIDIISDVHRSNDLSNSVRGLPDRVNSLLHSDFIEDIQGNNRRGNSYQFHLEENSVYDWTPGFPVFLFHLKEDEIVPYKNMEIAYKSFRSWRSSRIEKKDCSFKKIKDLVKIMNRLNRRQGNNVAIKPNHISCLFIFFLETSDYFINYR